MPPRKSLQPTKKGKGRGDDQDTPSPTAGGPKGQGETTGTPSDAPSPQKGKPAPPKRKTAAQKRREQEEAEEAFNDSLPDTLFGDLERDVMDIRAKQLLALPAWQGTEELTNTPSIGTSGDLPPSTRGPSPQLLQPPARDDTSSSASSRASKRRCETSPSQPCYRHPECR